MGCIPTPCNQTHKCFHSSSSLDHLTCGQTPIIMGIYIIAFLSVFHHLFNKRTVLRVYPSSSIKYLIFSLFLYTWTTHCRLLWTCNLFHWSVRAYICNTAYFLDTQTKVLFWQEHGCLSKFSESRHEDMCLQVTYKLHW